MYGMIKTFFILTYTLFCSALFAQEISISDIYAVNCSSGDRTVRRVYIEFDTSIESAKFRCYADIQLLDTENGREWKKTVTFDKVERQNTHSLHVVMYIDIDISILIKPQNIKTLVIPENGYCNTINANAEYALSAETLAKQHKIELIP